MLVGEGTESVGAEVDEGFHVVFGEAAHGYFGHVVPFHLSVPLQICNSRLFYVHSVVVVSIVMSPRS